MAVDEADVHTAAVMGGSRVDTSFSMARVECPGTAGSIIEEDGVAEYWSFRRGFAEGGTVVAGVVIDVANREFTEFILSEREQGEVVHHVCANSADGIAGISIVLVVMVWAVEGLLVQAAFIDQQGIGCLAGAS